MRAMNYRRASGPSADRGASSDPIVLEALARQAAARPAPTPPREMPPTPGPLPKVRAKRRRRFPN